jgi:pimeloyl-ACP methyl ester carboxylesterase
VLKATSIQQMDEVLKPYVEKSLKELAGDLRFYTTSVAVDDIDEVAQALGYERVNLYGGSYGATTVQYYLRQHGNHVRTAIMDGGTLLDIPIFELIAPNGQRALDLVFKRCEADQRCSQTYPDFRAEMQDLRVAPALNSSWLLRSREHKL